MAVTSLEVKNMTLAELIAESVLEIFPDRLAENWELPVKSYFKEALCDLQRMVKCLKENHADVYPASATYFKCGTSVVCAPKGQVRRVYTIPTGDWCQPIQYTRVKFEDISCWSRGFGRIAGSPVNTGLPLLQQGFKFPETVTDGVFGRAPNGLWAYDEGNKNIILAPWLQSNESVVLEWSGLKLSWSDADLVSAGQMSEDEWKRAIKAWVLSKYNKFALGDRQQSAECDQEYLDAKAMLVYDCRRITTNLDPAYACPADASEARYAEYLALQAGPVTVAEVASVYAAIADWGLDGTPEAQVAALVKGWDPLQVLAVGDANYPSGGADTIDQNNGKHYRSLMVPYMGSYALPAGETQSLVNRFRAITGNHDLDFGWPPTPFLDYFPWLNGQLHYSFVDGLVEFFAVNSGWNTAGTLLDPLGNTSISVQAAWLQAKMAASVAKYKVVYFHNPAWSSDVFYQPGFPALRWPFKAWGADLVINGHGHNYERILVDGLTYIVCGTGGAALRGFGPVVAGSQFRYSANFGAVKLSVVCAGLTASFVNIEGTEIDSVTLTNQNPVF